MLNLILNVSIWIQSTVLKVTAAEVFTEIDVVMNISVVTKLELGCNIFCLFTDRKKWNV